MPNMRTLATILIVGFVANVLGYPNDARADPSPSPVFTHLDVVPGLQATLPGVVSYGEPEAPVHILYFGDYALSVEEEVFFDRVLPRIERELVATGVVRLTIAPTFLNHPMAHIAECISDDKRWEFVTRVNREREVAISSIAYPNMFFDEVLRSHAASELSIQDHCSEIYRASNPEFTPKLNPFMLRNLITGWGLLVVVDGTSQEPTVSAKHIRLFTDKSRLDEMANIAWTAILEEVEDLLRNAS